VVVVTSDDYRPELMTDPLLDDLDPAQRAAVTTAHVPLAIIAPAGSGKTRVLTRRIAFRVREELAHPRHTLVLTFTRKAAGELLHRLRRLRVDGALTAGTFHAVALAQLRQHAADQGRDAPRILDRKARILSRLVNEQGAAGSVAVHDLASEIEWAKARMLSPEEYAAEARGAGRRLPRPAEELATLYHRYEAERRKRRLLDFDDVLAQCMTTMQRDPAFAAAQQWRFRHVFVDEFQDTTPLQLGLLRAWLAGGADLSVVGDPAQAIYGFAGADAAPLRQFDSVFSGGRTVALDRNYRSTSAIVAAAETVLGDAAGSTRVAPHAARAGGDSATVTAYEDDDLEAAGVAEQCWQAFTMGMQWHDLAVLFRTNAQSSRFEAAFARRGVPFRLSEQQRFLARPSVRVLLDWLREAERDRARPLSELLADLAADDETVKTDDLRSHRDALLELGREFLATDSSASGVGAFVAWLDVSTRGDRSAGGVELATFHRAKGLEWPVVFVTGLERGLVPMSWAQSPGARAEEQRLLHVAVSRARDELHCSWARARTVGTKRIARDPTPWLELLERNARHVAAPERNRAGRVDDMRAALNAANPPQPRVRSSRTQVR
jgi:DNA helicase-2/ATP-dependent DNA helicase PcrA